MHRAAPARVVSPDRTPCSQALRAAREQSADPAVTWASVFVTEVDTPRS